MKCTKGVACFKGSNARWHVFYYNNQTDKVCDQCYNRIQLDVSYRLPILSQIKSYEVNYGR